MRFGAVKDKAGAMNLLRAGEGEDELDDSHQTKPAVFDDVKACRPDEGIHPVIDVLPGKANRGGIQAVHEGSHQGKVDPDVIQQEDSAAAFRDAAHLFEAGYGIGNRAEDKGRNGRVEGMVSKGKAAQVRFLEEDVSAMLPGTFPGLLKHGA